MSTIPKIRSISTNTNKAKTKKLPPTPLLLPGLEYLEEHSSLGTGAFITKFFFYLGKGPVMFNFETRSNFICMAGILSTKSTSLLFAWRGSVPTVPGESRLYFPVGTNIKLTDVYTTAQTVPAQLGRGWHRHTAGPEKYIWKEHLDADYYTLKFL